MMKRRVYLARPYSGCDPDVVRDWYKDAVWRLTNTGYFEVFEPFAAVEDFPPRADDPSATIRAIVERDLWQMRRADVLLAYMDRDSTGVACEVSWAHALGLHVVLVCDCYTPPLFVSQQADVIFQSVEDAACYMYRL